MAPKPKKPAMPKPKKSILSAKGKQIVISAPKDLTREERDTAAYMARHYARRMKRGL